MKILLDPGHGGDKPGAVYDGVKESDITLAVALRAANVLRNLGHDVFLTRDRGIDIPLPERVRLINEYKCEAFLSIHCNASPDGSKPALNGVEGAHGAETYFRDADDKPLADAVQECLVAYTDRRNGGVYQDKLRLKKRLTVLNNDKVPCALVEAGYLSNNADRAYLIENISTLGEVLAHGVDLFACRKAGKEKTAWPA